MLFISGSSFVFGTTLIFIINFQSHGLPLKKDQLLCDPLEHKYYLTQFGVCSDCDKCFPGDEIEPLEGADVGIGLHGATLCLGCQQCREGTFNSEQNLQWYCSPCTVCADLGMVEIEPCTPTRDTICSDTPPDIQPHLNGKTNSSMVLPYKYRDKQVEKHVVFKTAIVLVILTICQTKSIRRKRDVYCDPKNHDYYVQQMQGCKECDRCWPGKEPHLQGADLGMGLYGATKCPKCRVCSEGTYNPDGDIYWYCLTCTKCSDSGLHEDEPCTTTQDTKCSNTVRAVQERVISTSYPYEYMYAQATEKHKDEDKVTDVSVSVVVTAVVVLLVVCGIMYKKESLRKCLGRRVDSTPEENMPLQSTETGQDPSGDKSKNEALENPEKANDERKNEKSPLVPKRTRHVSFGNYDNDVFGLDNDVDKDGEKPLRKKNHAFMRQMSQPCTKGEEKHIQYVLEKEDEKKRPSESFIRHLSKVLAPRKRYKKFAEYMGLERYQMELLAEEHEQPHRGLNAEDMSFEYTNLSLQRKQKLTRSDIYNALRKLGFDEQLANILEKRQRCRI